MELLFLILLSIGLSFDTFAVSVTFGCIERKMIFRQAAKIAFFFAFFQALMPLLGWFLGNAVAEYVKAFDHWIAFSLLAFVGIKMILESLKNEEEKVIDVFNMRVIITMSIATTIDAFVVGIVFASIKTNLFLALPVIGIITFLVAMLGMLFGKSAGNFFGKKMEIIGGVILILIGIKILIEHLILGLK